MLLTPIVSDSHILLTGPNSRRSVRKLYIYLAELFKMYLLELKICVFSDLSHSTNTVTRAEIELFISAKLSLSCSVIGITDITALLKTAERQIY